MFLDDPKYSLFIYMMHSYVGRARNYWYLHQSPCCDVPVPVEPTPVVEPPAPPPRNERRERWWHYAEGVALALAMTVGAALLGFCTSQLTK